MFLSLLFAGLMWKFVVALLLCNTVSVCAGIDKQGKPQENLQHEACKFGKCGHALDLTSIIERDGVSKARNDARS